MELRVVAPDLAEAGMESRIARGLKSLMSDAGDRMVDEGLSPAVRMRLVRRLLSAYRKSFKKGLGPAGDAAPVRRRS